MYKQRLVIFFLLIGVIYRLILTAHGNFIFNMDNARDMVDIREMVVLHKPRLIANTAAIEGLFYGPYWYYMSAIPFVITHGDPYGSILLLIALWVVGGYFLLILARRFGVLATIFAGSLWVSSNFVLLATAYAFNPNPAMFLTPVLIYLLDKYLNTPKTSYAIWLFALAGTFFSYEINFAIFLPVIILLAIILTKNFVLFKQKSFWLGVVTFFIVVSPQLMFDLRHNFLMLHGLVKYVTSVSDGKQVSSPILRIGVVLNDFNDILSPTFLNSQFLRSVIWILTPIIIYYFWKKRGDSKTQLFLITMLYIVVPIVGFILIPTTINSWHWVGVTAAVVLISSLLVGSLTQIKVAGKIAGLLLTVMIIVMAVGSLIEHVQNETGPSNDPSSYKNEVAAIDYVYQQAHGKNFKVYAYLPSVIDYPYQYLFWWYGQKKYGYIPGEYAYSPNEPPYISNKDQFNGRTDNLSGLVFLIEEPDRIGYRKAWEGQFSKTQFISQKWVGPLQVQIREEVKSN